MKTLVSVEKSQSGYIKATNCQLLERVGFGKQGEVFLAQLGSEIVCLKVYDLSWLHSAEVEYQQLQRARAELPKLRDNIQEPIGWMHIDSAIALVSKPVFNLDGSIAKNLGQATTISRQFFDHLTELLDNLQEANVFIRPTRGNILVKEVEDGSQVPVLIDLYNYQEFSRYYLKGVLAKFSPTIRKRMMRNWSNQIISDCKRKLLGVNLDLEVLPGREGTES